MTGLRVAVLTPPRDLSLRADVEDTFVQADEIAVALRELGHIALPATYRGGDGAELAALNPDIVVNLVEDVPQGPDQVHLVTALLDQLGLRYTGAPTAALAALGDKTGMKTILRGAGLPVAADLADAGTEARFIVKSATEHASIGIDAQSVVTGTGAALALIEKQHARHGGRWFAEAYIEGREFNVGVLETPDGPIMLPVAEILFTDHADGRPRIVGYAEKWAPESATYAATPRAFPADPKDAALFDELQHLARAAWALFGLGGYARVDFRVDQSGRTYILEVNANPCLAADAGFCAAAAEIGLSQKDVIAQLVAAALA